MEEIVKLIVLVLSGMATAIPLVVELIKYIQIAVKNKNWTALMNMVMKYMAQAEQMFDNGADRKAWVLGMIEASASTINYDIDMVVVAQMIDDLCVLSKTVNFPGDDK